MVGSVVFLIGAAIGVPRVFNEQDPEARLRMLEEGLGAWRVAQPFYGAGPLIAAAGVGVLAAGASSGESRALLWAAAGAMLAGGLAWCRSLYLRATRVADFAFGRLPAWPFTTYVLWTTAGLALLGIGLVTIDVQAWLGWFTAAAAIAFLAAYLRFGDIPPFEFYVLLLVVGAALI
jgi:hypothetical protein